jgi:catechol 2,3-dioxygenase-like lactoylglutathione lyase family enzyme
VRIHHVALRVLDLERAVAFYRDLLGLPETRRQHADDGSLSAVWLRAGDALLMLETRLRGDGAETGSGHLLAFDVADLAAWEQRLAASGVVVLDRTEATLYFRDPEGHRVGVSVYRH